MYGYFQQDLEMTVRLQYMTCLETVISEGLCPVRSPNIMPCYFYMWSNVKDKMYNKNSHTLHTLQENIWKAISRISPAELQYVNQTMFSHCNACLQAQAQWEHFQCLL